MCGICGFLNPDGKTADVSTLRAMCATLFHRGPDEEGLWVHENVALGMRRLKIIDLSTGSQPIFNEDRTLAIVFNGEIYNFQPLRAELEAAGHRFQSKCDTEVIVHGYEQWGERCVERFNGMFAFSLWDIPRKRLFMARDRVGKKPLYYYHKGQLLIWGSEIKAILENPLAPARQPDFEAIHHYLSLQYIPDPCSGFQGIRKLPAASWMIFENGQTRIEKYWELKYGPKHTESEEELRIELLRRLREAVQKRLISDVPLGVFLSGGIDSSVITALMAQGSNDRVKTFAIGFEEEKFSELPHARAVAAKYNTDHHEFTVRYDAAHILPELVGYFDEPFADSSALPTYYLSKMTREHVTVALTGDGGDETHAGYQRYRLDQLIRYYEAIPKPLRSILQNLFQHLPEPMNIPIERNWRAGLRRLAQVASISPRASILRWGSYFSSTMKDALYTDFMKQTAAGNLTEELLIRSFSEAKAESFLDRTLWADVEYYLTGDLLVKADRMTMANSIEGRSPFLDYELMEWTARLPENLKLRGGEHKYLLKRACEDLLPPEIMRRKKQGFGIPIGKWFREDLRPMSREYLLSDQFSRRSLFKPEGVRAMIEEHEQARQDHGKRLWTLLMLELWFRKYIDR